MGDSKIEWTDKTWNPVRGCSIVSKGCTNCYAMKLAHRFSGKDGAYEGLTKLSPGGPVWTGKVRLVEDALTDPFRWNKPAMVFVNSMSDLFHEDVPDDFIVKVFDVMRECANGWTGKVGGEHGKLVAAHTFQILTKRAARMQYFMERLVWKDGIRLGGEGRLLGPMLKNVWLGVSTEDQATFDERVELLGRTPCALRFVSAEPLLEDIDVGNALDDAPDGSKYGPIAWGIAGGESGPGARPTVIGHVRYLVQQFKLSGKPIFVKQMGARPVNREGIAHPLVHRKGGNMAEWPADLRVQEFPA